MKSYNDYNALVNGWSDPVSRTHLPTCEWNVLIGTYHEVRSCVSAWFWELNVQNSTYIRSTFRYLARP